MHGFLNLPVLFAFPRGLCLGFIPNLDKVGVNVIPVGTSQFFFETGFQASHRCMNFGIHGLLLSLEVSTLPLSISTRLSYRGADCEERIKIKVRRCIM